MTKTVFYILTFLLIVISQQASAQYVAESYSTMKDTSACDVMPQFRGGEMGLRKYIANNVRYPKIAKKKNIQGTVYIGFVVNEFGDVCNVEVLRGVHQSLDDEAVRVIKSLPKWKPATKDGQPVSVSHSVPIKFMLK